MPGLVPVAAQNATPVPAAAEAVGQSSRPDAQANVTSERKLFEYVAEMSEDKGQAAAAAKDDGPPVHAGPARQQLEPATPAPSGSTGAVQPVADAELDRTVEILMQVLSFAVETNLVASGSGSISRSVNTLLRGQ
jgi:hypothetical protein